MSDTPQPNTLKPSFWQRVYRLLWLPLVSLLLTWGVLFQYFFATTFHRWLPSLLLSMVGAVGLSLIVVLLLACIRHPRLAHRAAVGVTIYYSLRFLFESYMVSVYRTLYTDSVALTFLSTNPEEVKGGLTAGTMDLLSFLPLIGILAVTLILAYWIYNRIDIHGRLVQAKGIHRLQWGQIPMTLLLLLNLILLFTLHYPLYSYMSPTTRLVYATAYCLHDQGRVTAYLEKMQAAPEGWVKPIDTAPHAVVLVMGESLRRSALSLYGEPLPSSPYLDSLYGQGEIFRFEDVTSPAPNTAKSLQQVLSTHAVGDPGEWYETITLPRLMSRAGYFSYWLSNHEKQGIWIEQVAAIAATSDSTLYISPKSSTAWYNPTPKRLDEEMLNHLMHCKDLPKHGAKHLFQVVHMMGSHPNFSDRVPDDYLPFSAGEITPKIGDKQDAVRAQYLATVHYTDSVLNQIILAYREEPAIIIFASDHGFVLYDDPKQPDFVGHGDVRPGYEVPFLIYLTPSMREMHPEWAAGMQRRLATPFRLDYLTPTLLQLLGIESSFYRADRALFSEHYVVPTQRLANTFDGLYDYNCLP